ncbi:uncharacterized protein LOC117318741 [Pecten maximus]|uniref:uncharacterized protein LOC117318741 n=1 Tax=Pecten maximus TaxID=6579 RepID=UPI001458743A|nr:uncharacterized protein LOC117318741 [Pecten maximus]
MYNVFSHICFTGMRGRPKVVIEEDQLKMLHNMNYTAKQMAQHFGCSAKVVYKRLYACGLHQRDKYSNITDDALDSVVAQTQTSFPNAGSVMMSGIIQAKGTLVQRQHLRKSIERVNPIPVAQRFARTVSRRHNHVKMSNSLWHVDGHMKLIRWGISTHGGIDGYSRLIVFLSTDTNNKAKTVLRHFVKACQKCGVPSRVRSDVGGENLMIALFMNLFNGANRYSHITGRYVHNQRIERLWRDVFTQVIEKYYNQFYSMEDQGELDIDNTLHLLALKFAFVPDINGTITRSQQPTICLLINFG